MSIFRVDTYQLFNYNRFYLVEEGLDSQITFQKKQKFCKIFTFKIFQSKHFKTEFILIQAPWQQKPKQFAVSELCIKYNDFCT